MDLSSKFGIFRRKMKLDEMSENQAKFAQGAYIAGAQAAFQILAEASDKTREEAIMIWGSLQKEIFAAVPPPDKPLVVVPPSNLII